MENIVLVKGNIIGKSGCHVVKEMICPLVIDENDVVEVYDGDLILDNTYRSKSYCVYAATVGIVTMGKAILQVLNRPNSVYLMYQKEMEKCRDFLQISMPQHLQSDYYRHLYINIIGVLEFFLTELLESLVLGDKNNYSEFINKSNFKIPLSKLEESAFDMQNTIHKAIHDINAHDLKKIGSIFNNVFGVVFPDYSLLGKKIKTRHDLIHRNGYGVASKTITYVEVTNDMILSLMDTCNSFTNQLMSNLQDKINKWNEVFYYIDENKE